MLVLTYLLYFLIFTSLISFLSFVSKNQKCNVFEGFNLKFVSFEGKIIFFSSFHPEKGEFLIDARNDSRDGKLSLSSLISQGALRPFPSFPPVRCNLQFLSAFNTLCEVSRGGEPV